MKVGRTGTQSYSACEGDISKSHNSCCRKNARHTAYESLRRSFIDLAEIRRVCSASEALRNDFPEYQVATPGARRNRLTVWRHGFCAGTCTPWAFVACTIRLLAYESRQKEYIDQMQSGPPWFPRRIILLGNTRSPRSRAGAGGSEHTAVSTSTQILRTYLPAM